VSESIIEEPTAVILHALAAKARGEQYDEDAVEEAAFTIAVANLIAGGMSEEQVHRQMVEREYDVRIRFNRDEGLSIDLVWDDEAGSATPEGEDDG
jgi:hypothetical protein